jgi:uncharacterized protein (DUF58 family)
MEILNTVVGNNYHMATNWGWLCLIIFVVGFVVAGTSAEQGYYKASIVGLVLVLASVIMALSSPIRYVSGQEPTQLEVRITDPNYVIDALKYDVIEKRGDILVLKEVNWK